MKTPGRRQLRTPGTICLIHPADCAPFGGVRDYVLSPDGQWVVYTAYQDSDLTEAMFRAPSDGSSPPIQVNNPLPLGGYFDLFAITSDSSRVVYYGDQESDDVTELYSTALTGGAAPVKVNGPWSANAAPSAKRGAAQYF